MLWQNTCWSRAQHSKAHHTTAHDKTSHHCTSQQSTTKHNKAQQSTTKHSKAQHSKEHHGTDSKAQQSTAQHSNQAPLITSFFNGMKDNTSRFILLSRNGRKISCNFDTTLDCCSSSTMSSTCVPFLPMFLKPNQLWKTSRLSKIIGLTKLSSDQSSSRVFWERRQNKY